MKRGVGILALVAATLGGCDEGAAGEGMLRLHAYGEDYIEDQIPQEDMVDGWRVEFDTFLVAFEDLSADGTPLGEPVLVDLTGNTDGAGHPLTEEPFPSGAVGEVGYRIAPVSADAVVLGGVTEAERDAMAAAGHSLWVRGQAMRGDQTLRFDWAFSTNTHYVGCMTEAVVAEDGDATSLLTVHADHLFYDDLDSSEPNVAFDLIASADADGDGEVTEAELRATDIRAQQRYQVGDRDIDELWSFIEAQTRTVGHIDGEGHCDLGS